jgi:hypothetical protein
MAPKYAGPYEYHGEKNLYKQKFWTKNLIGDIGSDVKTILKDVSAKNTVRTIIGLSWLVN